MMLFRERKLLGGGFLAYEASSPGPRSDGDRPLRVLVTSSGAPRLVEGAVVPEDTRREEDAWSLTLRGEPGSPYRIRFEGLPPGRFDLWKDGSRIGRLDADRLAEGVSVGGVGPAAALPSERAEVLRLRDRLAKLAGDEGDATFETRLAEALGTVEFFLDADLAARRFTIRLVPSDADSEEERIAGTGGAGSLDVPEPERSDRERRGIADAVAALLLAASSDAARLDRVYRTLAPIEVEYTAQEGAEIVVRNRWLPPVAGSVRFECDPGLSLGVEAPIPLETVARGQEVPLSISVEETDEPPRLHAALRCRLDLRMERGSVELRGEVPVLTGGIRRWLLSRIYTPAGGRRFEDSEPPEWEGRPAPSTGDAFWRVCEYEDAEIREGKILRHEGAYALYAHAYVFAPEAGRVELEGEATGRIRIWSNESRVLPTPSRPEAAPGVGFSVPVSFEPGWNRILVKIEEGEDGWSARLRIVGSDPSYLRSLRSSARPPG
jgi:hypothetical protein